MKTFNHQNLTQQYTALKCNKSVDTTEKIDTIYYGDVDETDKQHKLSYEEHLGDYYGETVTQWTDSNDITLRIDTINLDEMPLDLSIRGKR